MSSNRDRALKVMNDLYIDVTSASTYGSPPNPADYLDAIEGAGLLKDDTELNRIKQELQELLSDLGQAQYGGERNPSVYVQGEMNEASRIGWQITRILKGGKS